ncbi:hypothetical protein SLEP1_g58974 [Rubroshorea leprosula]|uniref:Endonuclease/exonuclease/phosphatase domain-containing protein n=1 Tax=Rubroshorea leprosula TaxID=152421 RepID=A0AAV5MQY6_9ROSI|nr:hypothetical protein SLEP1_g58974 [Rubroshorea leprosula]
METTRVREREMQRPGQTAASNGGKAPGGGFQAVVGKNKWVEKQQPQGMIATGKVSVKRHEDRGIEQRVLGAENEGEGLGAKEKVQEKRMGADRECIIAFEPTKEETQWLEGGMVAVLNSLMSVTGIQERMDVDGGLLALFPLGGSSVLILEKVKGYLGRTFGEVVRVYEDTKSKAILCEGRVLVLCSATHSISNVLKLKLAGQLHEIQVMKEGWRSDPDWWLSEGDRRSTTGTPSEYSSTHIDSEDQRFIDDEILSEDEDNVELELLQENGILNSKSKQIDGESLTVGDGGYDGCNENGLRSANGLLEDYKGLKDNGLVDVNGLEEVNGSGEDDVESSFSKMSKDSKQTGASRDKERKASDLAGKRHRKVAECYPEEIAEIWNEKVEWVMRRTKQQRLRREKAKPINMQEVKKMMCTGRRLGMQFEGTEEEVESRLLELEEIDESRRQRGGLGNIVKRRELGRLVRVEKPNLLFLQETKLEGVEEGDGYVGIKGQWGVKKEVCFFVNIYAPNERKKKVALWDELRQRIVEEGGRWMLAGDFNAVRSMDERRGKTGESADMKDFDLFIETVGLVDSKLINRKFTWYRLDGTAMRRLDRILMTVEMSSMGGEWVQQGLKRNILDHCAIVLKTRTADWGPKSFRVLDAWQHHLEFRKVVEDKWNELAVDGFAETQFQHAASTVANLDMKNEEGCMKEDFVRFFEEFHQNGRLRVVMSEIISDSQSAFLGGRQLVDSVLVLNEVVEEVKQLKKAEEEGLIQGIMVGNNGLAISLLQFADDIVILGKANSESSFTVKTILRWFELMSGLRINFGKSNVFGFNVAPRWIKGAASALHCGVGETPFMYLGMPVGGKSGSKKMWDPVLHKFQAKLAVWKSAVLSAGGRLTLLNSVVWERYYGGREEVDITTVDTVRVSRLWREVLSIRLRSDGLKNMLVKGFRWGVGDGSRVDFWKAVWVGEKTLRDLCPRLFQLAIHKDGLVSEMGVWEEGSWRWRIDWRRGRRGREKDEEVLLWEILGKVQLKEGVKDCWQWVRVPDGKFMVRHAYEFLESTDYILNEQLLSNRVGGLMELFAYGLGRVIGKELGACIFLVTAWEGYNGAAGWVIVQHKYEAMVPDAGLVL